MKKKFLAVLLAVSMLAGTGLAVPGNLTVQAEENETVDADEGDNENDWDDIVESTYGDYRYRVLVDGTVKITYYADKESTEITIPSEINGKKVTYIGYDVFKDCKNLTSITIPDTVTTIGSFAFLRCESLTNIIIPNSVTFIDFNAFDRCIRQV